MLLPLLSALLLLWTVPAAAARRVMLVPCGSLPPVPLDFIKAGLEREFRAEVVSAEPIPVPESAYDPRRQQYRAEAWLTPLTARRRQAPDLVLGITGVDLYVPGLNFVFGLADPRQQCAIISLARLAPEFYGQPGDPHLMQERALKEAIHELGHLLGLGHCPQPSCIMFFSNRLADTDRKGPGFCAQCRRALK